MDYRCPDCSKYTGPETVELHERCDCSDTNERVNHHAKFYLVAATVATILLYVTTLALTWYVTGKIGIGNALMVMGVITLFTAGYGAVDKLIGEAKWRATKERNNWR